MRAIEQLLENMRENLAKMDDLRPAAFSSAATLAERVGMLHWYITPEHKITNKRYEGVNDGMFAWTNGEAVQRVAYIKCADALRHQREQLMDFLQGLDTMKLFVIAQAGVALGVIK